MVHTYWTEDELMQYEQSAKYQADNRSVVLAAEAKGEANKSIEIARNMLSSGLDRDTIAKCTGLPKSEIEKIQSQMY